MKYLIRTDYSNDWGLDPKIQIILAKSEGAIKQSRETGYTRQHEYKQNKKHNTKNSKDEQHGTHKKKPDER